MFNGSLQELNCCKLPLKMLGIQYTLYFVLAIYDVDLKC